MNINKKNLEKNQNKRVKPTNKQKTKTRRSKEVTIGKRDYINPETGVIETFNVVSEKDVDFNFQKIWLGHLLESLDVIGNKKITVLNWILANKNSDNLIIGTQRAIAVASGVSLPTVTDTIKALKEINAIKNIQDGVLMLNPDIVFQGGNNKRMKILLEFENINIIEDEDKNNEVKK